MLLSISMVTLYELEISSDSENGKVVPAAQPTQMKKPNRPRPVLVKLESAWDRRLLLANRRKLKTYTKYKLFIREDLPLKDRLKRQRSSTNQPPSNQNTELKTDPVDDPSSMGSVD